VRRRSRRCSSRSERLDCDNFYSQPLAKLERAHDKDMIDVREMLARGLVEAGRLLALYKEIEPRLHEFLAIDPGSFRRRVEEAAAA
jgi:hypothetical protein